MGSPIRCLDELYDYCPSGCMKTGSHLLTQSSFVSYSDVYMDHVNRKMSIDMLVSSTFPISACGNLLTVILARCLLRGAQLDVNLSSLRLVREQTSVWHPMSG